MKTIKLLSIHYHNFKGIKDFTLAPEAKNAAVFGANASGKTTLFDGFTWLLFGKNSDEQKTFNVKPLDENKKEILGLEPLVEATLEVNGVKVELKRELVEVWTKSKGQLESERKSDKTKLYVDGVPKKLKEYQEYISSIVDEDTFKLLTNPFAFNNLHWTARRDILTNISGDIDDISVINSNDKLKGLETILGGHTVSEQKKVINEQKKRIQKDIDGIPARIDEANRALPEVTGDADKLRSERLRAKANLERYEAKKLDIRNTDDVTAFKQKRADLLLQIKNEESSFIKGNAMATQSYVKDLNAQQSAVNDREQKIYDTKRQIGELTDRIMDNEQKKAELLDSYKYEKDVTFDEHATICPTCSQELPAEKVDDMRSNFNVKRSTKLDGILEQGTKLKNEISEDSIKLDDLKLRQASQVLDLEKAKDTLKQLEIELKNIEDRSGKFEDTEIFKKLSSSIAGVDTQIKTGAGSQESELAAVNSKINECTTTIAGIDNQLSQFDLIEIQTKRIAELRDEEAQLKDKFNELDRQAYLIDEFTRAKVRLLESKINEKFELVKFDLFDIQKNGNIDETCETTVNGIPYSTDLNNAAKINGGLDIVNTLSKFYKVEAPIFIDNAESVNSFIGTESQTISLVVSQDENLRVV